MLKLQLLQLQKQRFATSLKAALRDATVVPVALEDMILPGSKGSANLTTRRSLTLFGKTIRD